MKHLAFAFVCSLLALGFAANVCGEGKAGAAGIEEPAMLSDSPIVAALIESHRANLKRVPGLLKQERASEKTVLEKEQLLAFTDKLAATQTTEWMWQNATHEPRVVWDRGHYYAVTSHKIQFETGHAFLKDDLVKIKDKALRRLFEQIIADAVPKLDAPEPLHGVQLAEFTLSIGPIPTLSGSLSEGITFSAVLILVKHYPNGRNFPFMTMQISYVLPLSQTADGVKNVPSSLNLAAPEFRVLTGVGGDYIWRFGGGSSL